MADEFAPELIQTLRGMARSGQSPAEMARAICDFIGNEWDTISTIKVFRQAFHLSLAEIAPLGGLSRPFGRPNVYSPDDDRLNEMITSAIGNHAHEWDNHGSRH